MVEACIYDNGEVCSEQDTGGKGNKRRGPELINTISSSQGNERLYLRKKWGNRWRLGTRRKAGKVTRLKIPKVIKQPRIAEERSEDRCCSNSIRVFPCHGRRTYFIVQNSLEHDQTPCHEQGLNGIGEGVCLVGPGDVRGGDHYKGQPSMLGRLNEFMRCPILQYKAQDEHQGA